MFEKGDVVKYIGDSQRWKNKEFTIVNDPVQRDRSVLHCIRNNMTYFRIFTTDQVEKVESIPKFQTGTIVDVKTLIYNDPNRIGIIKLSNHLGSIVRYPLGGFAHREDYIPNSRLRLSK